MTCARQSTLGATPLTALHSARTASASAGVSVTRPPPPELTPPTTVSFGSICMTLAPRLAMVCSIEYEDPRPISIMAMTAAMPMMMPRQVRTDRMTFRRKARKAIRRVPWRDCIGSMPGGELRHERTLGIGLCVCGHFTGDHLLALLQIPVSYTHLRAHETRHD